MATIKINETDYKADYVMVQDHRLIIKFDSDEEMPTGAIINVAVGDTDLSAYSTVWQSNIQDNSLILSDDGSTFEPMDPGEPVEMEESIDPAWEAQLAEQARYKQMIEENQSGLEALRNGMQSYIFDGLKVEANPNAPVVLKLPMDVIANVYYQSGDSVFVAVKSGLAVELSHDFFEWWSGPNPFEVNE